MQIWSLQGMTLDQWRAYFGLVPFEPREHCPTTAKLFSLGGGCIHHSVSPTPEQV